MITRPHAPTAQSRPSDDAAAFHQLMTALLRHMQIPPPPDGGPEVYVLTFDGDLTVRLFHRQAGTADLVCHVGAMSNTRNASVLLGLLSLNRHTRDGPCLNIGVDSASGAVMMWTRMQVTQMNLDGLVLLLKSVLSRTRLARQYLSGRFTADSGATIHRKGRFIAGSNTKDSSLGTKENLS